MSNYRLSTLWLAVTILLLQSTALAHMALLYPMPRGGIEDKKQYDGEVHAFIGYNSKRTLPCNGYNERGPITELTAGEIIKVRFWGPALSEKYYNTLPPHPSGPNTPKKPPKQINQARHGGGLCQMSLSYDGGKTFHVIGQYTKSCPDFYYEWPVLIPKEAPNCNTAGNCLFVWTWTAVNVPQFYMNCADVTIKGVSGGTLNSESVQIVDAIGFKKGVTSTGDGFGDNMGDGPDPSEQKANENGKFS